MNFAGFINDIAANGWNIFGVEVYAGGRLLHSFGDTTGRRYPIYSATKTITSIAVGMASDEGRLDINRPVLDYMPGEIVGEMPESQKKAYENITVRRLLTMSVAGYPFRPEGESWLKSALNYPVMPEPAFDYSNVSAYLAGVAAARAVGEDLYDYLNRKLFAPLGIKNPPCGRCPDGYFYGASKMELTVNELSRIGMVLKNNGVYEGKRLLSGEYVREATSAKQMNREGGYGYFIWKYCGGFSINGKWQQKCYVLPDKDIMVTFLSHIEEKTPAIRESMERNIFGL